MIKLPGEVTDLTLAIQYNGHTVIQTYQAALCLNQIRIKS
jgi:hypothetical protein